MYIRICDPRFDLITRTVLLVETSLEFFDNLCSRFQSEFKYAISKLIFLEARKTIVIGRVGANLMSCGGNGIVRMWNSNTCSLIGEFVAHENGKSWFQLFVYFETAINDAPVYYLYNWISSFQREASSWTPTVKMNTSLLVMWTGAWRFGCCPITASRRPERHSLWTNRVSFTSGS